RVLTLERIAKIQRDRLAEPARAEKALRLALDNLDSVGVDRLAELLDERPQLRAELLDHDDTPAPARAASEPRQPTALDALFDDVVLPEALTRPTGRAPELAEPAEPVSLER